ncbi:MAG: single-stranded DNA-binding protein [Chthoniobacterales bacterium]
MANFNKVILLGNLTRDPEVRYTPKGTAVAEVGLAINRFIPASDGGEKREETTFVDVTLWGRTAEIAGEYLKKGRPVLIEGRLQLDSWDDKTSGQKRSKLKVVGESMQLLGGKPGGGGGGDFDEGGSSGGGGGGERSSSRPRASAPPPKPAASEPDDDEIPF